MSSEAFDLAETLPRLRSGATLDDARRIVEQHMPDKPETLIENVAVAYWEIWALRHADGAGGGILGGILSAVLWLAIVVLIFVGIVKAAKFVWYL